MINLYKDPVVDTTQYGYVYRITNLLNGKTYIGRNKVIKNKNNIHIVRSRLMRNIIKSNNNAFKYEIIDYANNQSKLNELYSNILLKEININNHGEYNQHSLEVLAKDQLFQIGIYTITAPSGKIYVGMTSDSFDERWRNHINTLYNNIHRSPGLQNAYNKYGLDNLDFKIVYSQDYEKSDEIAQDLLLREQQLWDKLHGEGVIIYNDRPTGTGSVYHQKETKNKISNTLLARRDNIYQDLLERIDEIKSVLTDSSLSRLQQRKKLNIGEHRLKFFINYYNNEYMNNDVIIQDVRIKKNTTTNKIIKDPIIISFFEKAMKNFSLTRDELNKAIIDMKIEGYSKSIIADKYNLTIKEISFICNKGKLYSPGLERTHVRFHSDLNKVYDDCQYCIDSGEPVNIITPTRDELYDLYVIQKLSHLAISNKYSISRAKVKQLLYKFDVSK